MDFDNPEVISTAEKPDNLVISFYNTEKYLKNYSGVIEDGFIINRPVPRQTASTGEEALLVTVATSTNAVVLGNLVAGLVMNAALTVVWASINQLQIMAHIPMNNIPFPSNSVFVFDLLINVCTFDFIPLTDIVAFDFTETDPINSNFDWLGYSSINTIELLGSLLLFFFVLVG